MLFFEEFGRILPVGMGRVEARQMVAAYIYEPIVEELPMGAIPEQCASALSQSFCR